MYNIFIKPWKIPLTDRLRNNTHINDFIMISPNIPPPNIPPPKYIIPTTINSMKNTNTLNDNMKIVRDLLEKIKKNENDDGNDDDDGNELKNINNYYLYYFILGTSISFSVYYLCIKKNNL